MTRAYNPLYLEDVMNNLGTMFDCAVHAAHCDLSLFYEMFLSSGVASQIEAGNLRYLSGLSGMELMQLVLEKPLIKGFPTFLTHPLTALPSTGRVGRWPITNGIVLDHFRFLKAMD